MAYKLSSLFSTESELASPSTDNTRYYGTTTKIVPHDEKTYIFVSEPGTLAYEQGMMHVYRSSSSGVEREFSVGPGGASTPASPPSNYVGIDGVDNWAYANFGKSAAAISSSAGVHFAVAAPGLQRLAGQVFLFHSSSAGVQLVQGSVELMTGSLEDEYFDNFPGQVHNYSQAGTRKTTPDGLNSESRTEAVGLYGMANSNDGVSLALDESGENLYISFYDSMLTTPAFGSGNTDHGGIRLYKSSSLGGLEHVKDITVANPVNLEQVGAAHEMIVADGKVYIAAGSERGSFGQRGHLFTYDLGTGDLVEDIYKPTSVLANENFGTGTPDLISGSDGIYILQASARRKETENGDYYGGQGKLYLFRSSSSGIELHSTFTGSNDDHEYGYNYFGGQAQLMTNSSGFIIVSSEMSGVLTGQGYADLSGDAQLRIWTYETGSGIDNAYYIDSESSTLISNMSSIQVGNTMDAQLSNDGRTLHLVSANPDYNNFKGSSAILYEWGLLPITVSTVAVGGGVGQSIQLEDASISVPETALASSTEITVEKKTIESVTAEGDTEVSDLNLSSDVVVMTPHGLTFDEPVTVTLTVDPMPANPVVYYQSSPGSAWEVFSGETTIEGNTISFQISSFSSYAVGGQNNMTCELSSSFSQEMVHTSSSPSLWYYSGGSGYARHVYQYAGADTKTLPFDDDVYTFVGAPGTKTHSDNSNGNFMGAVYIYRSGSSGTSQFIIGPGGSSAPVPATGSNYLGLAGAYGSAGASGDLWHYATFGLNIDAVSSSAGMHLAVAGPGFHSLKGRIFLFQSSSAGGYSLIDDSNTVLTGSTADPNWGGGSEGDSSTSYSQAGTMKAVSGNSQENARDYHGWAYPNDAVSLAWDDNEENLYISFYDSVLSDSGAVTTSGGIRLYKSSSVGGIEHLKDITASSPISNEQVGSAHRMIVDGGKIYIAASAYAVHRNPGQAYLFTYDVSGNTYTEDTYYPSTSFSNPDSEQITENFGTGTPDIVSGSDGIYILQGSAWRHDKTPYTPYPGLGRLYLFKSSSSGISTISSFTGSSDDDEYGYNFLGGQAQLMSGTSGFTVVTSEMSGALTQPNEEWWGNGMDPVKIWVYETGSNINTSYYIDSSNSTEVSNNSTAYYIGKTLDARMSNDGETLYIAASDPQVDNYKGLTILYEWGLSGSCSEQQQQQQGGQNMSTDKRGLAVYSGSSGAVHKFLDDGSSQIGTDSSKQHSMSGNLYVSASATYDIEAIGDVSASAYHGDGSNLTNINATPDISESSADFYFVGAAAISDDQSLVGESDRGPKFVEASKRMEVHALSASGDADLNGNLDVAGTSTMQAVNAQATTVTTLSASGQADFAGAINADGAVDFDSTLNVQGAATLQSSLSAQATTVTTMSASSNIQGGGAITIAGNADLNGTLDVAGAVDLAASGVETDIRGTLSVDEAAVFDSSIRADGDADLNGALDVAGTSTMQAVNAQATTVTTLSASGQADFAGAINADGAVDFDSTLNVQGATTLQDSLSAQATTVTTLSASGQADFAGAINADGAVDFDSTLDVEGATSLAASGVATDIRGTLSVDEAAVFDDTIQVDGSATFNGDVTLGNANTDKVIFTADISSSLLPDDNGTAIHDLGSSTKQWKDLYIDGVANIDQLGKSEDRVASAYINALDASTITAGATTVTTMSASSNIQGGGTLTIAGAADLNGALDVAGASNFQGATDHEGGITSTTLSASGDADLNGALAVAGAATMESTLAVNGNSTLGDANADLTTINGRLMMSSFSGQVAADRTTMETLAASGDASAYNGSMIYVSSPYTGSNASAAFFFDNGEKWYFCENGTWYPSSFNS
jgi:hypothetical protein